MADVLKNYRPKFRIADKHTKKPRVILQCSECDDDIRELEPDENIRIDRAYYCEKCDPGFVVPNDGKGAGSA